MFYVLFCYLVIDKYTPLKKVLSILLVILSTSTGIIFLGCSASSSYKSPITIEKKTGASGLSDYIIIYKNSAKIDFEITRPDVNDTSILYCGAGAFTTLHKLDIDGLYICKGKTGNRHRINHYLGGGIEMINGECTIFSTAKGKLITDSLVSYVENKRGSFFQQIEMIDSGKCAKYRDSTFFRRRGIVVFKNGKTAIAESTSPILLKTFTEDIAAMGAKELIYTDMGAWDEGWYRNPKSGEMVSLGYDHSQTSKQSNWVVFRR